MRTVELKASADDRLGGYLGCESLDGQTVYLSSQPSANSLDRLWASCPLGAEQGRALKSTRHHDRLCRCASQPDQDRVERGDDADHQPDDDEGPAPGRCQFASSPHFLRSGPAVLSIIAVPLATSPTHTTSAWGGIFASSTGPTSNAKAPLAAKAMLGLDAVDVRPSCFFTDQYDLSMEYTGDIGSARYDRVIFRRYPDSGQVIVFWLYEQRVQAGMTINIWDVADDIERLIQSSRPVNADDLADPAIPLASFAPAY